MKSQNIFRTKQTIRIVENILYLSLWFSVHKINFVARVLKFINAFFLVYILKPLQELVNVLFFLMEGMELS